MDMLCITDLVKSFGDKEVLRGLSLSVPEGSVFGFIGKNGAGKTTTMKAILGLLQADSGEITVNGERVVYGRTATNRHIGYLPDVPEFYPFMTAPEYLRFSAEILGVKDTAARTEELLALVGLSGEGHRIKGFSRGMKQRLGIAQALLNRPQLLLCDEPTSALDPVGRKEILEVLLAVKEQTTVLFSTHVLSDVERICTDVALLHEGRIGLCGSLSELKAKYEREEYRIEPARGEDIPRLAAAFPELEASSSVLLFREGTHTVHDLLQFVAAQRIPLVRIERAEPTLESVFLEVVKK
ncbi:MAG: ABC transporter ATP-binding protein [Clostridia bacterium]|nr:ABC transporter ATP-binding protein [Clostridia bacterium]